MRRRLDDIARALAAHGPTEIDPEPELRWASVAVILRELALEPEVLLIERARSEGDPWSGHMAFPGGRRDPADPAMITTAVRETLEEVALDLTAHGRVLGQLDDVPAVGRGLRLPMVVRPFVFHLTQDAPLVPDAAEVAGTVWIPVSFLLDDANLGEVEYEVRGERLVFPCYRWDRYTIWGLTLRMIESLKELVRAPV